MSKALRGLLAKCNPDPGENMQHATPVDLCNAIVHSGLGLMSQSGTGLALA
jgi:hypothetical protein